MPVLFSNRNAKNPTLLCLERAGILYKRARALCEDLRIIIDEKSDYIPNLTWTLLRIFPKTTHFALCRTRSGTERTAIFCKRT